MIDMAMARMARAAEIAARSMHWIAIGAIAVLTVLNVSLILDWIELLEGAP